MTGPFVPIEELAKHFSVSVSTIRAWVRQGNIPKDTYVKVGNTYRFCVGDVSKALTAQEEAKKTSTSAAVSPVGIGSLGSVNFTEHDPVTVDLDEDM